MVAPAPPITSASWPARWRKRRKNKSPVLNHNSYNYIITPYINTTYPSLSELGHMITHLTALQSGETLFITKGHGLKLLESYNHRRRYRLGVSASSCAITSVWVLQSASVMFSLTSPPVLPCLVLLSGGCLLSSRSESRAVPWAFLSHPNHSLGRSCRRLLYISCVFIPFPSQLLLTEATADLLSLHAAAWVSFPSPNVMLPPLA